MASFLVKVLNKGKPVAGAEVIIQGAGKDDTDTSGLAVVPVPAALAFQSRGSRYAARIGKTSGPCSDEAMPYRVTITYAGGAAGPVLSLAPDVATEYDVAR